MAEGHRRGSAARALLAGALVLVLAAVGAGVAGAFATNTSWLMRALGAAVGAVAGLVAAISADRAYQRRDSRATALRAREDVLNALAADPPSESSVFDVLLATSTEAAPFRGRRVLAVRLSDAGLAHALGEAGKHNRRELADWPGNDSGTRRRCATPRAAKHPPSTTAPSFVA
jgi:hypothetical protein